MKRSLLLITSLSTFLCSQTETFAWNIFKTDDTLNELGDARSRHSKPNLVAKEAISRAQEDALNDELFHGHTTEKAAKKRVTKEKGSRFAEVYAAEFVIACGLRKEREKAQALARKDAQNRFHLNRLKTLEDAYAYKSAHRENFASAYADEFMKVREASLKAHLEDDKCRERQYAVEKAREDVAANEFDNRDAVYESMACVGDTFREAYADEYMRLIYERRTQNFLRSVLVAREEQERQKRRLLMDSATTDVSDYTSDGE